MKIKVLHYLRHLALGGTEKTCQLFAKYLDREKFEVYVAYERTGDHPRLPLFQEILGDNLIEIDSYATEGQVDASDLQSVIDDKGIDVVHVYQSGYEEYPRPGIHIKVPHFVITNVFGFIDTNPRIDRHIFMSKWLMRKACGMECHSPKFTYIDNPVEIQPLKFETFWDELGWPKDCIIVGRSGRPENGIYDPINVEAAAILRKRGYDVRFLVLAPPPNMIKDLERLGIPYRAIEATTDPVVLSKFYNTLGLFFHARLDGETCGVCIEEAMMHHVPVITHHAVPANPGMGVFQAQMNLVENVGRVVWHCPERYANSAEELIKDRDAYKRASQAGRDKALSHFEAGVCARKLEKIYEDICK